MPLSDNSDQLNSKKIVLFGRSYALPRNRVARIGVGVGLIIGGLLGFLPVLGFWMIPLGIIVLSQDLPAVRRFRRKIWLRINRWWRRRHEEKK